MSRSNRETSPQDVQSFIDAHLEVAYFSADGEEARCICPLHDEIDPSFSINVTTGKWWCFKCRVGGRLEGLRRRLKQTTAAHPGLDAIPTFRAKR